MLTSRRSLFKRMMATMAGGAALAAAPAGAAPKSGRQNVVYHLSDLDKVNFVLGNIRNHIAGKGGPDKVNIVLVVHGAPLAQFATRKANPIVSKMVGRAMKDGVSFVACGNTMKAQNFVKGDFFDGFQVAEEGGVVRIADLQAEGYLYIRP